MKTALFNLWNVYSRYKWATVLNLIGLSLAFTICYIVTRQAWYEFNFNRSVSNHERIYHLREMNSNGEIDANVFLRSLLIQIFESSPHIEQTGIKKSPSELSFTCDNGVSDLFFTKTICSINKGYTEVFGFKWVDGDMSDFDVNVENIVIPASMARELFGTEHAAGKMLVSKNIPDKRYKITAVYRDFAKNTSVSNCIYQSLGDSDGGDSWDRAYRWGYVKLNLRASKKAVEQGIQAMSFPQEYTERLGENSKITLFPIDDLYFQSDKVSLNSGGAPKEGVLFLTYLLIGIASLILIIAAINYFNFSMALAPARIKSINTQKVLGASNLSLRGSVLLEAAVLCLFAYMLSLVEIQLLSQSSFARFFVVDISLQTGGIVLVLCAGIAVLVGVLAGLWPSFYVTSVSPALVLKGSFHLSPKGLWLRNLLIGFQFIITLVLLIISLFFALQIKFMLASPLGFDKEGLIIVQCENHKDKADLLLNQMKTYAGAETVFASESVLFGNYSLWEMRDNSICEMLYAEPEYPQNLGIEITEGRNFKPGEYGKLLMTENARKVGNLKLGEYIMGHEIIGFIFNIKIYPVRVQSTFPFGIVSSPGKSFLYMKLKPGTDQREAKAFCRKLADAVTPNSGMIQVQTQSEIVENVYQEEYDQLSVISFFCGIIMLIAIMGVFGLVIFETQNRRKEIAIRKINGADVGTILWIFNKTYTITVLICFVVSAPVAWLVVNKWLEGFAERIPVYYWVFAFALFIVLLLTAIVVSLQCWRTADENPINSLQSE